MPISTSRILDVLRAYDIHPLEDEIGDIDLPGIGEIREDETVYATTIAEAFREDDDTPTGVDTADSDDPRLREWWGEIDRIIEEQKGSLTMRDLRRRLRPDPPEPHCAWYCPIHYFGHGWGIYIRESCILSHALDIATFVHWPSVRAPRRAIARQLLLSAFYVFFLHEQFHHKVESLGLRLLVATGRDRYRPYKSNIYRRTYLTRDCLEESLANADSFRRLDEPRYRQRVDSAIRAGLRDYLRASIPMQSPGYAEGAKYFSDSHYKGGMYNLQSQVLDAVVPPTTPAGHWSAAPNMIVALADITDEIYVILPRGGRPIFRPASIDPGATVSSRALVGALTRHHGYQLVPGGKGSHIKLAKHGGRTIIIPGDRPVVSPGVVKQALDAIGGYPISRLPDLLAGGLS